MNNPLLFLATVIATILVYIYFRDQREQRRMVEEENERMKHILEKEDNEKTTVSEANPETKNLAFGLLKGIGCQPQYTDHGRIQFDYQGALFIMDAFDNCFFVNIFMPWAYRCSINDVDEFARLRKVMNEINSNTSCQVFYTINEHADEVGVHLKKNILLISHIPEIDDYIKSMLGNFFEAQRYLDTEIEKMRLKECGK